MRQAEGGLGHDSYNEYITAELALHLASVHYVPNPTSTLPRCPPFRLYAKPKDVQVKTAQEANQAVAERTRQIVAAFPEPVKMLMRLIDTSRHL
jgi:hypothetical protein